MIATISHLPTEVLELIYAALDLPNIYNLSKLNRRLHYTSLPYIIHHIPVEPGKEVINFQTGELHLHTDNDDFDAWFRGARDHQGSALTWTQTLSAVYGILCFPNYGVHSYDVVFPRKLQDTCIWLRALKDIMNSNQKDKMKAVRLDFSTVGPKPGFIFELDDGSESEIGIGVDDIGGWRNGVLGVLEEAVKRGCKDLVVVGGDSDKVVEACCGSKWRWVDDLNLVERCSSGDEIDVDSGEEATPVGNTI
ncbi:hypothetical protein BDN72DRAFT_259670 [Pluteus cervinus]|uniref:Uncharacterized protein n=1 Tax=Pluteus cervinus TaxID=181527 RepID=A0ACD3B4W8_9AGAR|nr:hypothetical protein BDN72DRAFT_259670 [Pluteus cervinus]